MKLLRPIFVVLAILCATLAHAEAELDKDYKLLSPSQPTHSGKKIEVMEFFFYGCSHCFHLHPALSAWDKKKPSDVEVVYVPTMPNPTSGFALFFREDEVTECGMTVEEAVKFVVSGGMVVGGETR